MDEAEYKWIELQAGGNVSQWCREQVLADYSGPTTAERKNRMTPLIAPSAVETFENEVRLKPKGKTCAHGVEKNYHCWQCGGLAKVEA